MELDSGSVVAFWAELLQAISPSRGTRTNSARENGGTASPGLHRLATAP
jgi:hypothetical protein